jgi:hypothetical protein
LDHIYKVSKKVGLVALGWDDWEEDVQESACRFEERLLDPKPCGKLYKENVRGMAYAGEDFVTIADKTKHEVEKRHNCYKVCPYLHTLRRRN